MIVDQAALPNVENVYLKSYCTASLNWILSLVLVFDW